MNDCPFEFQIDGPENFKENPLGTTLFQLPRLLNIQMKRAVLGCSHPKLMGWRNFLKSYLL